MSGAREQAVSFSVVIPAYNQSRWLGEAIASALAQDPPPMQVIVVDDGSTDDTDAVISPFRDRIELIRQENQGVAVARNRGMERASGQWIAFLDGDDRWRSGHLETLARAALENPDAGLIFTGAVVIDREGRELKKKPGRLGSDPFESLLLENTVTTSSAAVNRSCLESTGMFLPGLFGPEDWDLWLRIAHNHKVVHVAAITVDYRRHPQGAVGSLGLKFRDNTLLVMDRAAALHPGISSRTMARARANRYLESAVRMFAGLDTKAARKELLLAFRENPLLPRTWAMLAATLGGRSAARAVMALLRSREGGR